jgi:hypothetical protein
MNLIAVLVNIVLVDINIQYQSSTQWAIFYVIEIVFWLSLSAVIAYDSLDSDGIAKLRYSLNANFSTLFIAYSLCALMFLEVHAVPGPREPIIPLILMVGYMALALTVVFCAGAIKTIVNLRKLSQYG